MFATSMYIHNAKAKLYGTLQKWLTNQSSVYVIFHVLVSRIEFQGSQTKQKSQKNRKLSERK